MNYLDPFATPEAWRDKVLECGRIYEQLSAEYGDGFWIEDATTDAFGLMALEVA